MELILKLLMDGSFYMAVFMPLFLSGGTAVRAGILLILILWWGWLFINWKKRHLAEMSHENFMMEARILVFVQLFSLIFLGAETWKGQCAPFLAVFLVSGILLLRLARLSGVEQERKSFWSANGKAVFGVLAAAAFLSWRPVSHSAVMLLEALYRRCILPVLETILNLVFAFFMWLWPFLEQFLPEFSPNREAEQISDMGAIVPQEWMDAAKAAETPGWMKAAGAVLLLAFFILIFYYLYRRLSERGWGYKERTAGDIRRSPAETGKKKKTGFRELIREKNVRYYYRRFLSLCMMRGIETKKDAATSEEIAKKASREWGTENEISELRELYLGIRYGEKEETPEKKKRAGEIYRLLKEKAELKPR